jgi:2-desacetyl-2-hydroxyethyl bacteriochlorophyllide A dehydrogenase
VSVRAVVVDRPGAIAVRRREPRAAGAGDVRLDVLYAGICHTDHYILGGCHPGARYPLVPGHEVAGVVREVGPAVTSVGAGDRVAVMTDLPCGACTACRSGADRACANRRQLGTSEDGGWQEEMVVPAFALVTLAGTELSAAEGALLEPAANGVAAVRAAGAVAGRRVVVIGPGPIGLLAAQCARAEGAGAVTVVGLAHDARRLELARSLGLDTAPPVGPDASMDEAAALCEQLPGGGADAVIQCAGSVSATRLALALVSDGGAVVVEGYAGDPAPVPVSPDELATRRLALVGVNGWTATDFLAACRHAAEGRLRLRTLATHVVGLEDVDRALELSRSYADGAVKVLLTPSGEEAA